jgi:hypothetical protein
MTYDRSAVFSGYPTTNKTDCHDIAEILLKVELNTITLIRYCTTVDVSLLMFILFTHVFLTFLTTIHPLTFVMFALFKFSWGIPGLLEWYSSVRFDLFFGV